MTRPRLAVSAAGIVSPTPAKLNATHKTTGKQPLKFIPAMEAFWIFTPSQAIKTWIGSGLIENHFCFRSGILILASDPRSQGSVQRDSKVRSPGFCR